MMFNLENITELLDYYDNNIVVADNDNELILFKLKERGFVGTQTFCIQFNGKILKRPKRLVTVIKHINCLVAKYNLQDGVSLLLTEYSLESMK